MNASGEGITQPQPEIHHILVNRMERRQLLHDGIIESMQDEVFCLAGYSLSQDIAIQQNAARPIQTFEDIVPEYYRDFTDVFLEEESQRLPKHQSWDHTIDLEPGAQTHWKVRTYPMSPAEQVKMDKFLDEHIEKGYLKPSKSLMVSPVFFIRKKDGGYHLVQDYR